VPDAFKIKPPKETRADKMDAEPVSHVAGDRVYVAILHELVRAGKLLGNLNESMKKSAVEEVRVEAERAVIGDDRSTTVCSSFSNTKYSTTDTLESGTIDDDGGHQAFGLADEEEE
jgi:hypothetical protein